MRRFFNDFTSRKLERLMFFQNFFFQSLCACSRNSKNSIHMNTIVASVLFKTQLLNDTRHFVQSSLALDDSVEVSFSIVPFFFLKY